MTVMQEVVHIEDRVGPLGGEYWVLTLGCKHTAVRSKRPFRIWKIWKQPSFAPRRAKCIVCEERS